MTDRHFYASELDTEELIRFGELPEPLRLAEMLERTMQTPLHGKAAGALRRLFQENEETQVGNRHLHELNEALLDKLAKMRRINEQLLELLGEIGRANAAQIAPVYSELARAAIAVAKTDR